MTAKRLSLSQVCEIIDRIAQASHRASDMENVISYLHSASDISPLTKLLDSEDESSIRDGVYILSELGRAGTPLREKAKALLVHADYRIRYWAMNAVVSCFEAPVAKDTITAAGLLNDPDEFVRTRAHEMAAALGGRLEQ